MGKNKKMLRSFKNYLDTIYTLTYADLQESISSDIVWDDGNTRRNPTSYELFATHEHLDFAKEDIFKFSGIVLDLDGFEAAARKVGEIWESRLPVLFPGYEFVIYKDRDHKQVAFCRKRTGVSADPDEIIAFLTHSHHNVRWNALFSATVYPHPSLVPHLLKRLEDDDIYNRLKAIIALGANKDEAVVDILKKRFLKLETGPDGKQYINDFFAYDLFRTLIKLGDKGYRLVLNLFKKYQTLDVHTLEHLCELVGKTGDPAALDILLDIYFDDREASDSALNGLLRMEKIALPALIPFLDSSDSDRRKKAMWFLANCFNKDIRNYLVRGLADRSSQVREAAVHGIGRFYHRTRKTLLVKALADRSTNVRVKAVEALGNLFDSKLLPKFEVLCFEKTPQVRHEAMRAIAALDSREGLNFLNELYDQVNGPDRLKIIDSLYAYTGNPAYLRPIVAKALASADRRLVRETTDLLEML